MNVVHEVFEILDAVPLDHQKPIEEIGNLVDGDTGDSETIISWIRGQSPGQIIRHQTALAAWQPGTSRWFLNSSEYNEWTQRVTPQLGVLGNPACGKTTLCAAVVEQLNLHVISPTVGIAYYYWHNTDDSSLGATDLLRSIISQLCLHSQFNHETPTPLEALFAVCNSSSVQPSMADLITVFAAIVRLFDSCYIVMDGLEHCSDYSSFLKIVQGLEPRVCTLVTSRRSARLGQVLANELYVSTRSFIIEESHVAVDVEVVLRAKSASSMSQKVFMDEMTNTILQQAHGMFSWAVLQMERVLVCNSECEAKDVLDNLPTQIYDSWHNSLVRVFGPQNDLAVLIKHFLEILSAAARPLSHKEVEHFYESHLKRSPHIDQNPVPVKFHEIEDICSDFVAIVTKPEAPSSYTYESVKLVHPQLKILLFSCYLGETKFWEVSISKTQANLHMAESCLAYLLRFAEPINANDKTFIDRYPLLRYAAQYWYIHATEADELCLQALLLCLFTSALCFATWLSVHDPDAPDSGIPKANRPSPLYYACLLGFYNLAKTLLSQGARLDVAGGEHNYPLLAAVASGHREVVRLLLDAKDIANRRFKNGDTAIIRAASQDRADIFQLLVSHGADPNAKDKRHLTALHWALRQQCDSIVPLLLESGADINAKDIDGRTALHYTLHSEKPNTYLFNLLIDRGVDVLASDKSGNTMLHYATMNRYLEGMQSLIAAGAQVDRRDHRGWTALQEASSILWAEGVYYLLFSCYADPDLQDEYGRTALHCAVLHAIETNGLDPHRDKMNAAIIEYLLIASADQSLEDTAGLTPLGIATSSRSSGLGDVLKVLELAQTQENLKAIVLHLKPKHLDKSFPIKLPASNSKKSLFKIGMLRRRAAKISGIKDVQSIRLFMNDHGFYRELCDDTMACKDEGLKHNSEVVCEVRKEGDSKTSAADESINISGNANDDGHQNDPGKKPDTSLLQQEVSQSEGENAKPPNSRGMSIDDGSTNAFDVTDVEYERGKSLESVNSYVEPPISFQEVHLGTEMFDSLGNNYDDTCEKFLPAVLKKLDIDGEWREYALHIVHDSGEEICLSLSDKPWVIYDQLATRQRKPRLMVRRHGPGSAPSRDFGVGKLSTSPSGIQKPYHCDYCPQSFNKLHDLKRHDKIHSGLKPFLCQYCDKSFTREAALERHIIRCGSMASPSTKGGEEGTHSHATLANPEDSPPPIVDNVSLKSETVMSGKLNDDEQKEPTVQPQERLHQPVPRISGGDKSANTTDYLNQLLYMVTFKALRASVYYVPEATGLHVRKGGLVIVEADRGEDLGTVASDVIPFTEAKRTKEKFEREHHRWLTLLSRQPQNQTTTGPDPNNQPILSYKTVGMMSESASQGDDTASYELRPKMIKRLAQSHETHTLKDKEKPEARAKHVCQGKAVELGLDMEILEAEFQMDRKNLTFYYIAQEYINYNSLVRYLFKIYPARIWMSAVNPSMFAGGSSANDNVEGEEENLLSAHVDP